MAFHLAAEVFILLVGICLSNGMVAPKNGTELHHIEKRNAFQEGWMIECVLDQSSWWSWLYPVWAHTNYADYGCYCGYGGSGVAVDDSDRCCQQHDNCWAGVKEDHDLSWARIILFNLYEYNCSPGRVTCSDPSGSWRRELCECDKTLSTCLNTHRHSYNTAHRNSVC
uniref:phospholipase A2 n=1 Tax=Polyandrocarpa misakiensis TaxID=7723 RepID=Q86DU7_POLMI|nr:phospholipase A2 [Polyandrocarpa misakiensis]